MSLTKQTFQKLIPLLVMFLSGAATIVFTVLSVAQFDSGFVYEHAAVLVSVLVSVEVLYLAAMVVFLLKKWKTLFKFFLTGLVIAAVLFLGLYLVHVTGLWDRFDSVEELREFIRGTGAWAPIVFIICQAMQVFLLPIPGVLTVGAGVLIFGELLTCLYSYVGILLGSLLAFWIGRVLGYKAAAWLVGRESLDKWLQKVKGRDRMILSVMFILPLFPDDILCFVCGLSTMTWRYFIILQLIARAISVTATSYSLGGSIIPYNTWWGILLWIVIAAAIVALFIVLWKKGDKIEKWFFSLFKPRAKSGAENAASSPAADEKTEEPAPGPEASAEGRPSSDKTEPHV